MDKSKLLLSGLRALLGNITPNVRRISINQDRTNLLLFFYYDMDPTEVEIELSEIAASEIIADFSEPFLINCERLVVKSPERINEEGDLLYSRYEP